MVCYNFVTTLLFFLLKDFFLLCIAIYDFSYLVISRIIVTASHSKIIIQMSPKSHHRHSTRQNTSSQQANQFTHKQSTIQIIYTQTVNKPKYLHTSNQKAKSFTHKQSTSKNIYAQAVNKPYKQTTSKNIYTQAVNKPYKQTTSKNIYTQADSPSQNIYTQAVNKQKHSHTSSQQAKTFTSSQ